MCCKSVFLILMYHYEVLITCFSRPKLMIKLCRQNEKTRDEVHGLVTNGNVAELERRFLTRIQFGTAGLRGRMTAGFSMMNDVIVIQTSQVREADYRS